MVRIVMVTERRSVDRPQQYTLLSTRAADGRQVCGGRAEITFVRIEDIIVDTV
jgi:hypothetical protein